METKELSEGILDRTQFKVYQLQDLLVYQKGFSHI